MELRSTKDFIVIALCVAFIAIFSHAKAEEKGRQLPLLMPDVQPKVPETYLCTAFKMPQDDFEYIVRFTPNASMHTAHHILIYGCEIPGQWEPNSTHLVWDCGEMSGQKSGYLQSPTCSTGSQVIYSWAKDAPPLKLPEGVGFKVGKNSGIDYLVLQVHYAHVEKFLNGETDNSGIVLTLVPGISQQVTKVAGVYVLRTKRGMIRAQEEEHFEVACRINEPVVLHPFAFRTHTHALGKVVAAYKIDQDGKWQFIGKHNPQEPQMFYPIEDKNLTIEHGDTVASRCTMYNFRLNDTYIGRTSVDEMCCFYMMYYVDGDNPMNENYCYSDKPSSYYWGKDPLVRHVPQEIDEKASVLDEAL